MIITEKYNSFKVKVLVESTLTATEDTMLRQAVRIFAQRIGSKEFFNFCMKYHYTRKITTGRWWNRQTVTDFVPMFNCKSGLTRSEIYNKILEGEEVLQQGSNGTADIILRIDRRRRRTIGYTYPNTITQWIYSWVLHTTPESIAGNLAHEWCHKLGFEHDYYYNYERQFSVPYAVGDFVAGIVR
jgi:hypothetical protein